MKRLTNVALVLVFVVIGLGALTRLLDAGLGCPDWPGCYGFLTPPNESAQLALAEKHYPDTPVVRHQAWMEMVHRYAAGTLGLIVFWITFQAFRTANQTPSAVRTLSGVLSTVVVIQAAFGMWTVTMKLWPPVVTLHLLGGFFTFGLLIWLRLALQADHQPNTLSKETHSHTDQVHSNPTHSAHISPVQSSPAVLKILGIAAFIVLLGQVSLGAWTSSNYAGLACPDFPTCQNQWLDHISVSKALTVPDYDNLSFLHGRTDAQTRVSIQVLHRVGALLTCAVVLIFAIQLLRSSLRHRVQLAFALTGLLAVQVCLGIFSAIWLLPLPVALAHNLVAALLFGAMVFALTHVLRSASDSAQQVRDSSSLTNQTSGITKEVDDDHFIPHNS